MGRLSAEDRQALEDRNWWRSILPEGYYVIGFTYRDSALIGMESGGSIDITKAHLKLLRPDLLEDNK